MRNSILDQTTFLEALRNLPASNTYWLGLSGGLDSSVLLYLLHHARDQHQAKIHALHVNHGLQPQADEWQSFVEQQCENLAIGLTVHRLEAKPESGESLENWAREQRMGFFHQVVPKEDCLLLAHHQSDQAETMLLQLFRGSGVAGLAAMPAYRKQHSLKIARPLLNFSREQIRQYAEQENILWVEDHSNQDERFDRNYLRQTIIPTLKKRWPGIEKTLARASKHQAEALHALTDNTAEQYKDCLFRESEALSLTRLAQLEMYDQCHVLRYWLRSQGYRALSDKQLTELLSSVINARTDSQPCLENHDYDIRRYQDALFVMPKMSEINSTYQQTWRGEPCMEFEHGTLHATVVQGRGILRSDIDKQKIIIRYRKAGDKIKTKVNSHHKDLKSVFQEYGVLPWMRAQVPLISMSGSLICVPGLCTAESVAAKDNQPGIEFSWQPNQTWLYPKVF